MARKCRNPEVADCWRCGSMNHWVHDCPEVGRMQASSLCGNYGSEGHFARMCKELRSICRQCGIVGHIAGMCWSTRHGVHGNQDQERRQVNQGGCVGTHVISSLPVAFPFLSLPTLTSTSALPIGSPPK